MYGIRCPRCRRRLDRPSCIIIEAEHKGWFHIAAGSPPITGIRLVQDLPIPSRPLRTHIARSRSLCCHCMGNLDTVVEDYLETAMSAEQALRVVYEMAWQKLHSTAEYNREQALALKIIHDAFLGLIPEDNSEEIEEPQQTTERGTGCTQ